MEKSKIVIKIADVESHFSKGVSFREFGANFWPRLSPNFSTFTKIKVSSVAGIGTFYSPFMSSVAQPASLVTMYKPYKTTKKRPPQKTLSTRGNNHNLMSLVDDLIIAAQVQINRIIWFCTF